MVTVDDIGLPEKQQQQLINYSVGNPPFNYNISIFPLIVSSFQSTLISHVKYKSTYVDEYRSNDASQFGSEYDRRDSGVSSSWKRSWGLPGGDRREFEARWRYDRREHRGPPRVYDDDKRRDEYRFDDRKKRDRDDSENNGGGESRSLCRYFFTPRGCRYGSGCRFSHKRGGDRKHLSERSNERDGPGWDRVFEDGGGHSVKRFRGPGRDNIQSNADRSSAQPPAAEAGRGCGRHAHINKPAWIRLPFDECKTIDDVLKLVMKHIGNLSTNCVAGAWSSMSHLLSKDQRNWRDLRGIGPDDAQRSQQRQQQLQYFFNIP
jgi:hypothetical protein